MFARICSARRAALLAVGGLAALSAPASAHEHHYVPRDYPTIQAAIDAADADDAIIISPGIYSGPGNVDLDTHGLRLTIQGLSIDPRDTIIDCGGSPGNPHRGFFLHGGETNTTIIDHLTIRNGYGDRGGAILCEGAGPTIFACIIDSCSAEAGGGIWCGDGATLVLATRISNCSADNGAGVYVLSGAPTIARCTLEFNHAQSQGAGVFCNGGATLIEDSVVRLNISAWGGAGVMSLAGDLRMIGSIVAGNAAGAFSGGVSHNPGIGTSVLVNSIVWANTAPEAAQLDGFVEARYSVVQGGYPGQGNSGSDPMFVDALGGDFRLASGSPCIDAGDNSAVTDLVIGDLAGNPRIVDGNGDGSAVVDIGALEYFLPCPANWNGQDGLNSQDFFDFLASFFAGSADYNADGSTNSQDFFDFLIGFFAGCP